MTTVSFENGLKISTTGRHSLGYGLGYQTTWIATDANGQRIGRFIICMTYGNYGTLYRTRCHTTFTDWKRTISLLPKK